MWANALKQVIEGLSVLQAQVTRVVDVSVRLVVIVIRFC